ncbi:MAG: nuclear transport factor 2 family protein [Bacteroidota bacterium]
MPNQEIAKRLHKLVKAGEYNRAYDELFSPEATAKEPQLAEMGFGEVKGIEAVKQKVTALSAGMAELKSRTMSEPIVTGTHIAFTNIVNGTLKDGNAFNLSEICLYKVEGGKIVSEEFIY